MTDGTRPTRLEYASRSASAELLHGRLTPRSRDAAGLAGNGAPAGFRRASADAVTVPASTATRRAAASFMVHFSTVYASQVKPRFRDRYDPNGSLGQRTSSVPWPLHAISRNHGG